MAATSLISPRLRIPPPREQSFGGQVHRRCASPVPMPLGAQRRLLPTPRTGTLSSQSRGSVMECTPMLQPPCAAAAHTSASRSPMRHPPCTAAADAFAPEASSARPHAPARANVFQVKAVPRVKHEADQILEKALNGAELSLDERIDCLLAAVEQGKPSELEAKGNELFCLLGTTGAGKSSLANWLSGCEMELVKGEDVDLAVPRRVVRVKAGGLPEVMPIGHGKRSKTFAPGVCAATTLGQTSLFVDCPGFVDNRGIEISVANAVNIRRCLASGKSLRLILVVDYHEILSGRGQGITELCNVLVEMFGSAEQMIKFSASFCIVISKAPLRDEVDDQIEASDVTNCLEATAGMSEDATAMLRSLAGRSFLYHPMDKGHPSWKKRPEMLKILNSLEPLKDPSCVLKVSLSQRDEPRLRRILKGLVDRVVQSFGKGNFYAVTSSLDHMLALNCIDSMAVSVPLQEAIDAVIAEFDKIAQKCQNHIMSNNFQAAQTVISYELFKARDALLHVDGLHKCHSKVKQRADEIQKFLLMRQQDKKDAEQAQQSANEAQQRAHQAWQMGQAAQQQNQVLQNRLAESQHVHKIQMAEAENKRLEDQRQAQYAVWQMSRHLQHNMDQAEEVRKHELAQAEELRKQDLAKVEQVMAAEAQQQAQRLTDEMAQAEARHRQQLEFQQQELAKVERDMSFAARQQAQQLKDEMAQAEARHRQELEKYKQEAEKRQREALEQYKKEMSEEKRIEKIQEVLASTTTSLQKRVDDLLLPDTLTSRAPSFASRATSQRLAVLDDD